MTEIEPTIDNVTPGAVVTIERGGPGKPGHTSFTHEIVSSPGKEMKSHEATVSYLQKITEPGMGYRITRITRPAPPVPSEQGERFWARWDTGQVEEYIVTDERELVHLDSGTKWRRADFPCTVVPAPEPETVPVPADLIREADGWFSATTSRTAVDILRRIVRAVREREGGVVSDLDLPYQCHGCGAFVGQERGQDADEFHPAPCRRCRRRSTKETTDE